MNISKTFNHCHVFTHGKSTYIRKGDDLHAWKIGCMEAFVVLQELGIIYSNGRIAHYIGRLGSQYLQAPRSYDYGMLIRSMNKFYRSQKNG